MSRRTPTMARLMALSCGPEAAGPELAKRLARAEHDGDAAQVGRLIAEAMADPLLAGAVIRTLVAGLVEVARQVPEA